MCVVFMVNTVHYLSGLSSFVDILNFKHRILKIFVAYDGLFIVLHFGILYTIF